MGWFVCKTQQDAQRGAQTEWLSTQAVYAGCPRGALPSPALAEQHAPEGVSERGLRMWSKDPSPPALRLLEGQKRAAPVSCTALPWVVLQPLFRWCHRVCQPCAEAVETLARACLRNVAQRKSGWWPVKHMQPHFQCCCRLRSQRGCCHLSRSRCVPRVVFPMGHGFLEQPRLNAWQGEFEGQGGVVEGMLARSQLMPTASKLHHAGASIKHTAPGSLLSTGHLHRCPHQLHQAAWEPAATDAVCGNLPQCCRCMQASHSCCITCPDAAVPTRLPAPSSQAEGRQVDLCEELLRVLAWMTR